MTTRILITGDLHLTNNPRDEYRWDLFRSLRKLAKKHEAWHLVVLGDITDKKDRHSGRLVNRIVDAFDRLKRAGISVYALKGNHDYDQDPSCPFFRFLPGFITEPKALPVGDVPCLFVPHVRKTDGYEWPKVPEGTRFVFCHQTFVGAVVENGTSMDGLSEAIFAVPDGCEVVSGDIHVPQRLKRVVYAGAPYPVRFGDTYEPRVLLFNGSKLVSLPRATVRKVSVVVRSSEDLDSLDLKEGDQAKITVRLRRRDLVDWPAIREKVLKWSGRSGVRLEACRVEARKPKGQRVTDRASLRTPEQLFQAFCEARGVERAYVKAGEDLIHADAASS